MFTKLKIVLLLFLFSAAFAETWIDLPLSGIPVDLVWSREEELLVLQTGIPHLIVLKNDSVSCFYDLDDLINPAGITAIPGGGFYVSDSSLDKVFRYDRWGILIDEEDAPGKPGDLTLAGMELLYVAQNYESILSVSSPEFPVVCLLSADVSGADLSSTGRTGIIVTDRKVIRFSRDGCVENLLFSADAVANRSGEFILLDENTLIYEGTDSISILPEGFYSRLAVSPDGRFAVLDPDAGRVLLWP